MSTPIGGLGHDNPFWQTITKLEVAKSVLQETITNGNWEDAEREVSGLRDYITCFYCKKYRASLEGHYTGICGNCPCHKIGEEILGRARGCNGCYVVQAYRDLVRNAHWFEEVKSVDSANALIRCIEDVIVFMNVNKEKLGG